MPNVFIKPFIQNLRAGSKFTGPEGIERARGRKFRARLGANESGFGPSPNAIAAMQRAAEQNWMYADPDNHDLIQAIAHLHHLPAKNIAVGEGIDGLLGLGLKLALMPGETVITSNGAYLTFNHHVACHAGRLVKVPYRNDREDLAALADAARRENAKIVYVSNPDNPMGSWWTARDLADFKANLPETTLLFLDEAYCETAPENYVPDFDLYNPRVVRFRTFSKAYGLAGARIGFVVAHEHLINAFNKVRNQYGINRVGQIGALAAINDQSYLKTVVAEIARARDKISSIARDNGLEPLPSATNFVAIDCGRDGAFAKRVREEMFDRDVFIRMPGVAPLNRCIRVSTGTDADLDIFKDVLPDALKAAGKR